MFDHIGIMQGRLLPKYQNRYQAHPLGYWQKEFELSEKVGINYIEFILDYNDFEKNPLMSPDGVDLISETIIKTGVGVRSVCADYFMEAPLHSEIQKIANQSIEVLKVLLINSHRLEITDIVIPCVDQSSLKSELAKQIFTSNINLVLEYAEKYNVNLALETDLGPSNFKNLLERFDSAKIKVNYDTGNSASLGYDILEEFEAYGEKISDIHIKDRKLNGGSVKLGNGDTDFDNFFKAVSSLCFEGPVILQAYRDDEGVKIFKEQFEWFKNKIAGCQR